jgi:hypothetical protein
MSDWPTKNKDLATARLFIENYAISQGQPTSIGLIEIHANLNKKSFDLQLAPWVLAMTIHFQKQYGLQSGETISRKILTHCITQGQVIH